MKISVVLHIENFKCEYERDDDEKETALPSELVGGIEMIFIENFIEEFPHYM